MTSIDGPRQRQAWYLYLIEYEEEGCLDSTGEGRGKSAALPGFRECMQYVSGRPARSLQSRWSNRVSGFTGGGRLRPKRKTIFLALSFPGP